MIDTAFLAEILAIAALVATPVLAARWLGDGEAIDLTHLFVQPWALSWPHGVQEEEPVAWRLDLLEPHRAAGTVATRRQTSRPAARPHDAALAASARGCV